MAACPLIMNQQVRCYACGQLGHMAMNCPTRGQQNRVRNVELAGMCQENQYLYPQDTKATRLPAPAQG